MTKPDFFVSATIVLFLAVPHGTAASPTKDFPEPSVEQEAPPAASPDDNLAIAPAPRAKPAAPPSARYYPYQQQLTFRAGRGSDFPRIAMTDSVLGFQYLFPKFLSPKLEAGGDLHEEGTGHLHVGWRWIANERSYFRPSVKISLDHKVESKDSLATLTHFENYFARFSGTLEQVVFNPYSVRLESELLFGIEESIFIVTLGISHGW